MSAHSSCCSSSSAGVAGAAAAAAFTAIAAIVSSAAAVRRRGRSGKKEEASGAAAGKAPSKEAWEAGFGENVRDEFLLDFKSGYTFLNHGSFGTSPASVQRALSDNVVMVESFPDDFYRRRAVRMYKEACTAAATAFLGLPDGENTVLVSNATTAVNCVLRSANLGPSDAILVTTITYNACHNAARAVSRDTGAKLIAMELPFEFTGGHLPMTAGWLWPRILESLEKTLKANPDITIALLDHISSMPAAVMPIKAMTKLCHDYGVQVVVDGAHAPGQLELDVADIGAEWYTGNLHKWAFAPKGTCVLYAKPSVVEATHPLVVSHFWQGTLHERFYMQGTNDQGPYLSLHSAIQFRKRIGGASRVMEHNHRLAAWAADMLAKKWGTVVATAPDLCGSMTMVRTPLDYRAFQSPEARTSGLAPERDHALFEYMSFVLFSRSGIQAVFMVIDGAVFTRLSAQVYNTKKDFEDFGDAVLGMVHDLHSPPSAGGASA